MILAIDVGFRNLALVAGHATDRRMYVSYANLLDLGNKPTQDAFKHAIPVLSKLAAKGLEGVVIEQQHARNQRAYALAHCLLGYFSAMFVPVRFVSPVNKFRLFVEMEVVSKDAIGRGDKQRRKKLAVQLAQIMINKLKLELDLSTYAKKDDISDALLYLFNEIHEDVCYICMDRRRVMEIML